VGYERILVYNHSFIDNMLTKKQTNTYKEKLVILQSIGISVIKIRKQGWLPIYLQIFSCQDVAIKAARLFYQCSLTEKGR